MFSTLEKVWAEICSGKRGEGRERAERPFRTRKPRRLGRDESLKFSEFWCAASFPICCSELYRKNVCARPGIFVDKCFLAVKSAFLCKWGGEAHFKNPGPIFHSVTVYFLLFKDIFCPHFAFSRKKMSQEATEKTWLCIFCCLISVHIHSHIFFLPVPFSILGP